MLSKNQADREPRVHKHLLLSTADMLQACFEGGRPSDKVLEYAFKQNKKWGARDRKLVAETLYSSVRWWRKLLWALGYESGGGEVSSNSLENPSEEVLTSPSDHDPAEYKLKYPKSVYLEVVLEIWLVNQLRSEVGPASLHSVLHGQFGIDKKNSEQLIKGAKQFMRVAPLPAIELSVPDWLMNEMARQLGLADTVRVLARMNQQAPVFLRVNRLKTKVQEAIAALQNEGIATNLVDNDCLVLPERANVFKTAAFKNGFFEVQDYHSQLIAPFLGARPGERIIDACAGAGGKTLHVAAMMQNRGKIIALDVHEGKLNELRQRATRAGATTIDVRWIESTKVIKRLAESADRVLLDVPCTGVGVLRRNPDSKWRLSLAELRRLEILQSEILEKYSTMMKPDGVLVYATCSVLPSENEDQITRFLLKHPDWFLEEHRSVPPNSQGGDGFFMARLRRRLAGQKVVNN